MSSPIHIPVSLESNSSSSSRESSEGSSSPESSRPFSVEPKRKIRGKSNVNPNKRKLDKYLISADQWTPITGPAVCKNQRKSLKIENQDSFDQVDPITNLKLVRLFESDPDPSSLPSRSPDEQLDDSILVTTEEKVSLYVTCFEEMLWTVLEHEHYLFSTSELKLLCSWEGLSYPSKYLLVRLFMRKHENWFRLDKLSNYREDIGDIKQACEDLCKPVDELLNSIPPRLQNEDDAGDADKILPPPQLKLEPFNTKDEALIAELLEYLDDHDPSDSKQQTPCSRSPSPDPAQLEKWCLLVGQLSCSLDEALDAYGIDHGSLPDPSPYDVTDSEILPNVPPIPPPVNAPGISIPKHLTSGPKSPAALDELDPELSTFASMTSNEYPLLNNDDLFACMKLEELKALAKKLNANPHTTRDMIILGIKAATKNQSTLCGAAPSKDKQPRQLSLKFTKKGLKESQILSLNSKILKMIGPCIKLAPAVCSLFKRVHLIFYRSTAISEKTMTASILSRMNIRNYYNYQVARTDSIFESREKLLSYESALEHEKQFTDLLVDERRAWNEDHEAKVRRQAAKTLRLKKALEVFESAWLLWQQAVMEEDDRLAAYRLVHGDIETDHDRSTYYKNRFHPGWPLTRIVHKGTEILAKFKEFEREVQVLEALLQQRHFRRGKRGQWYDRLALVLMTHLATDESIDLDQKRAFQNSALYTCEQGLADPDTHQIYRFSLSKRLLRLRKLISREPTINPDLDSLVQDDSNLSIDHWKPPPRITLHRTKLSDDATGQKSLWLSPLNLSTLTVEEIALEYYVSQGWRGFHSEGGILRMIVSLVFWDIFFAPVPGAFQTPFQAAPLDIATDAFAIVRKPLIEERLARIEERGVQEIQERLSESYRREFDKKTCCIGIGNRNWELYPLEDLLQIVDCLPVSAFKLISLVLFEDWATWSAGAPDLCLWMIDEKRFKFAEVKGPGDRLSEKQKNWFDLLSKAEGVEIEICAVKEE